MSSNTTGEKSTNKGVKNVLYNYLGRFGSQAIGVFTAVYIVRGLSLQAYGDYNILLSISAYIALFTSLGLTNVIQRFIPEFASQKQFKNIGSIIFWGIGARLVSGLLAIGLLALLAIPIRNWLQIPDLQYYLRVYGPVILLTILAVSLDVALTSLLKQLSTNLALLVFAVVRGVGVYYAISRSYGLVGVLIVELAAIVARCFMLLGAYWVEIARFKSAISQRTQQVPLEKARLLRFASWAYLNDFGYLFFNTDTDNFIISNYLGSTSVGLYAFANKIVTMLLEWSPIAVASNIISPLVYGRYTHKQDKQDLNRIFRTINKANLFFFAPILMAYLALNENLVKVIFGGEYLPAVWLLGGILAYQILNIFQYPLGLVVFALEQNQINFYSRIFSVYNLIADLILVRMLGVSGVLFATASAITFKNLFIYFKVRRHIELTLDWQSYIRIFFNAFLTSIILWLLRGTLVGIASLAFLAILGLALYLLVTIFNNVFSADELALLEQSVGNKIPGLSRIVKFASRKKIGFFGISRGKPPPTQTNKR